MKITSINAGQLIVSHKPWKLPLILFFVLIFIILNFVDTFHTLTAVDIFANIAGILFLLISIYLTSRKSEVVFNSTSKTVRWSRQEIFKTVEGNTGLTSIEDIIKQISTDTEGDSYRVAILLKNNQRIPLVYHYSTVEDHDAIIQQIKTWLSTI